MRKRTIDSNKVVETFHRLGVKKQVCQELGIDLHSCINHLRKMGIDPTNFKTGGFHAPVLEHTDKELGYLCGFIAIDGCLDKKQKGMITMCLHNQDIDSLRYVGSLLVKEPRIRSRKGKDCSEFSVTNHKIYQYFLDIGITPAKTFTLDVRLDDKSEEFRLFFLRGVLDGDGTVSVRTGRVNSNSLSICTASSGFADTLQNWYGGNVIRSSPKTRNHTYYHLRWSGKKAIELATILPKNDFTMKRKTSKLVELINIGYIDLPPRKSSKIFKLRLKDGRVLRISEVISKLNSALKYRTFKRRLEKGWSLKSAIMIPVGSNELPVYGKDSREVNIFHSIQFFDDLFITPN